MDVLKIIAELREEHRRIDDKILKLERKRIVDVGKGQQGIPFTGKSSARQTRRVLESILIGRCSLRRR
jgi:hypothetical protein